MSATVDVHVVQQFTDGITHLAQQKVSRLRGYVDIDPKVVGDRAYYNQLGQTSMTKRVSRHGDTEYTDTPHHRRMVTLESWDVADLLDTDDKVQMLTDPLNSYSQSFAMAAGRKIDDVIIEAAFATAKTGKTGTGSETWPTTEQPVVDEDLGGADSGLNLEKVRQAKLQLDENEVPDDGRYIVCSAQQIDDMIAEAEVQSIDTNTYRALVNGTVTSFMGFDWIRSERLLTNASGWRRVLAFQRNSLKLAIGINPRGRISEMPNKRYSMQAFYEMRVGATRMDPYGVVEIECVES